jgi:uncharacterized protein involved in cysteine biosynthesis
VALLWLNLRSYKLALTLCSLFFLSFLLRHSHSFQSLLNLIKETIAVILTLDLILSYILSQVFALVGFVEGYGEVFEQEGVIIVGAA